MHSPNYLIHQEFMLDVDRTIGIITGLTSWLKVSKKLNLNCWIFHFTTKQALYLLIAFWDFF